MVIRLMHNVIKIIVGLSLLGLAGCYSTTTKAELDDLVQRLQGNTFQGKLIYERSDEKYDYYRIEDLGVRGRYRVPRGETAGG
jgi:hypothetical protein